MSMPTLKRKIYEFYEECDRIGELLNFGEEDDLTLKELFRYETLEFLYFLSICDVPLDSEEVCVMNELLDFDFSYKEFIEMYEDKDDSCLNSIPLFLKVIAEYDCRGDAIEILTKQKYKDIVPVVFELYKEMAFYLIYCDGYGNGMERFELDLYFLNLKYGIQECVDIKVDVEDCVRYEIDGLYNREYDINESYEDKVDENKLYKDIGDDEILYLSPKKR